ncbi:hypothetical protein M0805_004333 [Coniferiporia weirii]|nr:hypothetical protein M0805_004333 [Coniferiporia weirii]
MGAPSRRRASFASLPPEIAAKILLELDWRTVLSLQLVNATLHSIVKTHKALQYHIELGVARMVDGPSESARCTTSERLARLRLYQARWRLLSPARRHSVRAHPGSLWELAGGVLAQSVQSHNMGGFGSFGASPDVRKLCFTRLPVGARGDAPASEWTHSGYEFSIRDFTMDPGQDLLVLVRAADAQNPLAELHLRSLRTNKAHPAAARGVLTHKLEGGTLVYSHLMQVCEDRFGVLHTPLHEVWPEKLVVYNWKTGELEFEIQFCGTMTFAFLTRSHILLAVRPFNVVPARHGDQQPRFVVCDVDATVALSTSNSGSPGAYAAIAEFHLPELQQYADVEGVIIHSEPAPAPAPIPVVQSQEECAPRPCPAFSTAPHNRLIVITIDVATVPDDAGDHRASEITTLAIFVPLATFLPFLFPSSPHPAPEIIPANRVEEGRFFGATVTDTTTTTPLTPSPTPTPPTVPTPSPPSKRTIAVPWTAWLHSGARMLLLPGAADHTWVCNVAGSRFVYALEPRDPRVPRAPRRYAVLDFNGEALRAPYEGGGECGYEYEYDSAVGVTAAAAAEARVIVETHTEPSTLVASTCGVFEADVTTGAGVPYRRTVVRDKARFDGVMLTEDGIVFVNRGAPSHFEVLTL